MAELTDAASRRTRRLLFLAYHFPPVGGAGTQRAAKFARYLPEFGFAPVVVTGSGAGHGRWTPHDDTLLADAAGAAIERVAGAPAPDSPWRRRADRWLQRPTARDRWWQREAVAAGMRAAAGADVILATMSPWATAEAAAELSQRLRMPWVADLRDPWALDEMQVYPTAAHRRRELARMRRVLSSAAAVVMNTPEAARRLRALPGYAHARIETIPNGYDAADFAGPAPQPAEGVFRIVHTGYLHTALGRSERSLRSFRRVLGGTRPGVDILPRSHVYLMRAINRVLSDGRVPRGKLELHLAGVTSAADLAGADATVVRALGYLSHADAVALMRSADLLFLPMHDVAEGTRATIVPGKTYEYLASGRPILAAVPDGDARDVLAAAGNALLCRPSDVDGMAAAIARAVAAKAAGHEPTPPPPGVVATYDRRELTRRLAGVLEAVAT